MDKDYRKLELAFEKNVLSEIRVGGIIFNGYAGDVSVPEGVEWSQELTEIKDGISWRFRLRETAGKPLRSGFLKVKIPYSYPPNSLNVWSASRRFPDSLYNVGGQTLYYGDVCYGTLIPLVSLYDEQRKVGLTIAKSLGRTGGRFAFRFGSYHEEGMEVVFSDFALDAYKTVEFELLLCGHVGCWRPGLRWLADRYPDYFLPHNPDVWKHHGAFAITSPFSTTETVKRLEAENVQWSEVHNHFPNYGCFAPHVDEWDSVVRHDYPDLKDEVPGKISPSLIREHIRRLHASHILAMMYIQCSGDGLIPWAEENFPDSIARDSSGKPFLTWKECCFLNADPSTSFGKFVDAQIDRFLKMYSEMDGLFIDQLCYQTIDYAHFDGVTCANDRPAYQYAFSYEHGIQKLTDAIHGSGRLVWGNGPFDIEIAKYVDGSMTEGSSDIYKAQKFLGIRKPRLVHLYPTDYLKTEAMLKHCLLAGAAWSIGGSSTLRNPPVQTPEIHRLFQEYIPLATPLMDTEICLEAHPFTLPFGYLGECFRQNRTGHYFISVVGDSDAESLEVAINLHHGDKAVCRGNKNDKWTELPFEGDVLHLPNDSSAYVISL
ncbi:MAG: hypothetical protein IJS15_16620 [Victivallales bacterium]|nr:hypothetical protein [Victivallales bacterium]